MCVNLSSTHAQININSDGFVGIKNPDPEFNLDARYGEYYFGIKNSSYEFGLKIDASFNIYGPGNIVTLFPQGPGVLGKSGYSWWEAHISNLYTGSDERFKKNIAGIDNALDRILSVEAFIYEYSDLFYNSITGLSENSPEPFDNRKNFGFIAQQLLDIFPELVLYDTINDTYSVNYIGMIPPIVEALKQQQEIIDAQSKKIKELDNLLETLIDSETPGLKEHTIESAHQPLEENNTDQTNAFLFQNAPNPFSTETRIDFYIPVQDSNATIYIFDLQGNLINSIPLPDNGSGSVTIQASSLQPGMYLYTLVVDGQEIDTKRMILTR